jgi:uncharacterized protein (DUF885 family)
MRQVALLFCAWILPGPTVFHGDLHAFPKYLLTDPTFYYTHAQSLVSDYGDIAEQIDPKLAEFGALPLSVLETHLREWVAKRRGV